MKVNTAREMKRKEGRKEGRKQETDLDSFKIRGCNQKFPD